MEFNGKIRLAPESKCVGCFACVDICSQNAISIVYKEDGHNYVEINDKKCVACKQCENICNKIQHNHGNEAISESMVYGAWAKDSEWRKNGTSGGVFAAFAHKIIDNGGYVVGAYFDGYYCRHVIVDNHAKVKKLQGSKYVTCSMKNIYHKIKTCLEKGPVLFTGVGCQCAAVISYFDNNPYKERLYTVDLVCGGAPSRILLEKFFTNNKNIKKILSFRSKDKYELSVLYNKQKVTIPEKSLPLDGFNCGMTNRLACYDCKYAHVHRTTDITIGDLWDYTVLPEEHKKGISMIIVHNDKGKHFLSQCEIKKTEISWENALLKNKRTAYGHQHIFLPRLNLIKNARNMNELRFEKLYCIKMTWKDIDLMLFRIYRFIVMRLINYKAKKYIRSLISKKGC